MQFYTRLYQQANLETLLGDWEVTILWAPDDNMFDHSDIDGLIAWAEPRRSPGSTGGAKRLIIEGFFDGRVMSEERISWMMCTNFFWDRPEGKNVLCGTRWMFLKHIQRPSSAASSSALPPMAARSASAASCCGCSRPRDGNSCNWRGTHDSDAHHTHSSCIHLRCALTHRMGVP